jgi:hypothetical protein
MRYKVDQFDAELRHDIHDGTVYHTVSEPLARLQAVADRNAKMRRHKQRATKGVLAASIPEITWWGWSLQYPEINRPNTPEGRKTLQWLLNRYNAFKTADGNQIPRITEH